MAVTDPHNPWMYAEEQSRDYMTPEDISDAIAAGAKAETLHPIVLEALSQKSCEDWSLCAFVAYRMGK